ncbi:Lipoprotein-releasing system ATP-binding protein LolD [anaerobic digester metagenome]
MENNSIIITKNLIKRFPMGKEEFTALRGISLNFGNGEFAGLIGPSGSGKTTLLNIIGSLDVPTEGEALVLGRSIGKLTTREAARLRKENIGFIFQSYNLLAVHTVYENVEFPLLLLNLPSAERRRMTMEALEWVGLTDKVKSKPPQLSGGQCQRVAIARAMVKKPSLVLADEPTANLDADNSHHILQTMETLNRELKTTFIFATHDDKVISYLHRKIFLLDGRVDKDEIIRSN